MIACAGHRRDRAWPPGSTCCWPRLLLAGAGARRPRPAARAGRLASRGRGGPGAQRGRRDRPLGRQPAGPGLSRRLPRGAGGRQQRRRHRRRRAPRRASSARTARLAVLTGRPLARGLDRQAVGGEARASRRAGRARPTCGSPTPTSPMTRRPCAAWSPAPRPGGLALVSLMARLQTGTWAERLLIPAFVFFFDMLYPFGLGERSDATSSPRRPAAACWCGARRWRRPAASPRSAARSSTTARWARG